MADFGDADDDALGSSRFTVTAKGFRRRHPELLAAFEADAAAGGDAGEQAKAAAAAPKPGLRHKNAKRKQLLKEAKTAPAEPAGKTGKDKDKEDKAPAANKPGKEAKRGSDAAPSAKRPKTDPKETKTADGQKKQKKDADKKKKDKDGTEKETDSKADKKQQKKEKGGKAGSHNARYILFLGNLPLDASVDDICQHFKAVGPPKAVRILTHKDTGVPRGCAFIEWSNSKQHMSALLYHQTMFKGRKINVELSAGGGGNTPSRKGKIEEGRKKREEILRRRMAAKREREAAAKDQKDE